MDLLFGFRGRRRHYLPTQISGCVCWYDAAAGVTITVPDTILAWADQSGNGNDANQPTIAKQPTYTVDAFNRPYVSGSMTKSLVTNIAATTAISQFIVTTKSAVTATIYVTSNNGGAQGFYTSSGAIFYWYNSGNLLISSTTGEHVFGLIHDASHTETPYVDGVAGTPATGRNPITAMVRILNYSNDTNGHEKPVREFVRYNRALTTGEIAQLSDYFRAKWGTP